MKTPVPGVIAPIAEALIVPPEMVRASDTRASVSDPTVSARSTPRVDVETSG